MKISDTATKAPQKSKHQFRNLDSWYYHFSSPLATHEGDGGGAATSLVRFIDFLDDPECKGRIQLFSKTGTGTTTGV
jgi:hypothetical protein